MQMNRRLSKFIGLGNESSSSYSSVTWDAELFPDGASEVSAGGSPPSTREDSGARDAGASGSGMQMNRRFSTFFGMDPGMRDDGVGTAESSQQPGGTNELVSLVKKKMSVFFSMTRPQETSETPPPESSRTTVSEIDLPTFSRAASRHHPGPKAGGIKTIPTKPRIRGAPIQFQHQVHMLSTLQLISITFFAVSGGPYGFEPTVGAGGPGLMLVGLLLVPAMWAAPLALMTAELSCMIPESGGHVLWVYRAFGPFWSFINSCFAFACSVLDNAMYPVLFVEYLSALTYEGKTTISYGWSVFLKIFIVVLVTFINILGINIVGVVSVIVGVMVLAPFITMCLIGITVLNFDWMGLDETTAPSTSQPPVIDWGKFLTLLLWNTSGFDAAGTMAAEVRNPGHAFPRALSVSVALMVGVYAIPTIIGVSVLPDPRQWKEGTYIRVAKLIGGNILKGWMGFSAASSALGLLLTRLCTNSRIVYGMALVEQVPQCFSKLHPVYATPWMAILLTSCCTLLLTGFNFYSLAEADMLFYGLSTILKFCALVQLRFTEPDAFRPYKIPMQDYALAAATIVPVGLCVAMLGLSSERAHGIGLVGASFAVLLFTVKELYIQYGTQAEEAMQDRVIRVQQNLDSMQKRIDRVIEEEFAAPVRTLGQAFRQSPQHLRSGLTRSPRIDEPSSTL